MALDRRLSSHRLSQITPLASALVLIQNIRRILYDESAQRHETTLKTSGQFGIVELKI